MAQSPSTSENLEYLRSHGFKVETPEDRRNSKDLISKIKSLKPGDHDTRVLYFVALPAQDDKVSHEESIVVPRKFKGDVLEEVFKDRFAQGFVDMESLRQSASKTMIGNAVAGDMAKTLSQRTVDAIGGSVDKFRLGEREVFYLDDVGALKSLPKNRKAIAIAAKCGFGEVPFFGDVYLCRYDITERTNLDFRLSELDDNTWTAVAMTYNLKTQTELHAADYGGMSADEISSRGGEGEGFSWRQTPEEVEVVIPLQDVQVKAKDIKVNYKQRSLEIKISTLKSFSFSPLYSEINPDECTWSITDRNLVVTLQKRREGNVWSCLASGKG